MEIPKIKRPSAERDYLTMKIPLQAKLNGSFADIISSLSSYPNLHLFSKGSELKYAIDCGSNFCLFTFGQNYVIQEIYSGASPIYHLRDALLRMLSVIAYLGELYSIKIESIFPYLVSVLAGNEIERNLPQSRPRNNSDVILAKRIIQLTNLCEQLTKENATLGQEKTSLLFRLILNESATGPISRRSVQEKYLVSQEMLQSALKLASKFGYRVILQNLDRIEVVKE